MKKCTQCGRENDTVMERACGFTEEIHGKIEMEVVCDDCEYEHLGDI